MLEFAVAPGAYVLDVTVEDSITGRKAYAKAEIQGFRTPPAVSDLLLSPQIRVVAAGDTVPQAGELRVGNSLVTGAVELHLTPLRSRAYYLLEAYSGESASGTLTAAIRDSTGKTILKTPPAAVNVPAGGGVLKGQLDLTGLPAGRVHHGRGGPARRGGVGTAATAHHGRSRGDPRQGSGAGRAGTADRRGVLRRHERGAAGQRGRSIALHRDAGRQAEPVQGPESRRQAALAHAVLGRRET